MISGIYVHIPFCLKRCFYCDFFSGAVDSKELRKEYTKALLREITFYGQKYGKSLKADTIFFGGGTPSLMEPELIDLLLKAMKKNFAISRKAEISLECNPATLNIEKLNQYKKSGVNRLSIGAQSFDDKVLEGLGRVHKSDDISETFEMARKAGFDNINLDLMFAVPGQGILSWKNSLKKAISLKPEHLSFYSLEIAENTVFDMMLREGKLKETPVETDRKMYTAALEISQKAGYSHYEISNAALPGMECKHNYKYWRLTDYLGLGASAHSFIKGVRYSNVCNTNQYIKAMQGQDLAKSGKIESTETYLADCVEAYHVNTFMDNASEYVFTALRTKEGVQFDDFKKKLKRPFWAVYEGRYREFEGFVEDGFAVSDESHIALTQKGIDISNKIMAIFV